MKRKTFNLEINASRERVWDVLWNDKTYGQWTAPFCEGTYAESDWNEGSEILFMAPNNNGMYGIIDKKKEPELMAFKHLGEIQKGEKVKKDWDSVMEIYELEDEGETTNLKVSMDMEAEYEDFFDKTFPKALENVKKLAENQQ
ncbi:MAG TPA: SRPBCC domain-containing protein [Leeuwenhoekiella sp.]|nr:SRPBCC domain-containing protein [Leeuwenhoekiella sp.]